MSELELRSVGSPDVAIDSWFPSSEEDVYFLLQLEIGQVGSPGADLFELVVATTDGMRQFRKNKPALTEPGLLILDKFSWEAVRTTVAEILAKCDTGEWVSSVQKLQNHFLWEYADYKQED